MSTIYGTCECMFFNSVVQHDLAKSETTHLHHHAILIDARLNPKSAKQSLSSSFLLQKILHLSWFLFSFFYLNIRSLFNKKKRCAAAHDFVAHGIILDYCSQLKKRVQCKERMSVSADIINGYVVA